MELKERVALVTGAARRVGRTIAERLAERGTAVAVHYNRSRAEAEAVVAGIERAGGRSRAFGANLETVAEIERMVGEVLEAFGRIDVLVNCASVFYRKPIEEVTERDWDANLDTNLKAPFFLSKFAGAAMRRQGAGKIVNIGDWAGIRPYNNYLPYTVSKSGLIGLTRALAKALAPEVQVNCVALGPVMPPEEYSEEENARLVAGTLVKRLGSPEDVARAVLFLCEGTDFATGATLVLDGGRLLN
jgi:pteridine reductase